MLKRPRNRQPRGQAQGQQQQQRPNNGRQNGPSRSNHHPKSSVPTVQQVVPGASVSIVLKADQPTGRETPGVVQDVLTQGNHPRGIKVRLQDGQVGRVQRMGTGAGASSGGAADAARPSAGRFTQRYTDVRYDDEYPEGPPPRSLADFFPAEPEPETSSRTQEALVTCPLCGGFEGDETAVTHHIEKEHLT
ncbi:unnamed protein product [Clonostachys byssicola]|uniref:UBZ4-type domain-containing protein n=1 Tax=Clonostachys byssicola TaxID=160290 RepID=A0A9N9UGA9_9HYPO|nr:unnamed protein product [Clonostachys byssicola]